MIAGQTHHSTNSLEFRGFRNRSRPKTRLTRKFPYSISGSLATFGRRVHRGVSQSEVSAFVMRRLFCSSLNFTSPTCSLNVVTAGWLSSFLMAWCSVLIRFLAQVRRNGVCNPKASLGRAEVSVKAWSNVQTRGAACLRVQILDFTACFHN